MSGSGLAEYIRNNGGPRGNFQFRIVVVVKGVEFSSPIHSYKAMLKVLDMNGLDYQDVRRILARPAGQKEWWIF